MLAYLFEGLIFVDDEPDLVLDAFADRELKLEPLPLIGCRQTVVTLA